VSSLGLVPSEILVAASSIEEVILFLREFMRFPASFFSSRGSSLKSLKSFLILPFLPRNVIFNSSSSEMLLILLISLKNSFSKFLTSSSMPS